VDAVGITDLKESFTQELRRTVRYLTVTLHLTKTQATVPKHACSCFFQQQILRLTHPRRLLGGLYHGGKFGRNRYSSFDNVDVLIFCKTGSKKRIQSYNQSTQERIANASELAEVLPINRQFFEQLTVPSISTPPPVTAHTWSGPPLAVGSGSGQDLELENGSCHQPCASDAGSTSDR